MTAAAALVTRARALYALAWCGKSPALRQDATAALDATMRDLHDADEAAWRATVYGLVEAAGVCDLAAAQLNAIMRELHEANPARHDALCEALIARAGELAARGSSEENDGT